MTIYTLQIDRSYPEVNLAINDDLLDAGVLAVNLMKNDTGSGVREVDLYRIMPGMLLIYIIIRNKDVCLYV